MIYHDDDDDDHAIDILRTKLISRPPSFSLAIQTSRSAIVTLASLTNLHCPFTPLWILLAPLLGSASTRPSTWIS